MTVEIKTCRSCNRAIQGRSDKKFCNDFCRNAHHNQHKTVANSRVRKINQSLLRNRRILENVFTASRQITKTTRKKLEEQQFDFHYFTHQSTNHKGHRFVFCYEYGYRILKDAVLLMREKAE